MFVLFKQKTAYEMRISDWSSDVCSSDLKRRRVKSKRAPDPCLSLTQIRFCGPGGRGRIRFQPTLASLNIVDDGPFSKTVNPAARSAPEDRKSTRLNSSH